MAKFKKYSQKALCVLSACVCFIMAVFYPFEEFRASESTVPSSTISYTNGFSYTASSITPAMASNNFLVEKNMVTYDMFDTVTDSEMAHFTEFDFALGTLNFMTSSSEVYAYKIICTNSLTKLSYNGVSRIYTVLGNNSEIAYGKGAYVGTVWNGANSPVWYINNYNNIPLFISYNARVVFWENDNARSVNNATIAGTLSMSIVPYTVDDLTDEIYETLTSIYATDTQMLTYLKNIYSSVDTVETKLQNLYNIANSQLSYLKEIDTNTDELESLMAVCNSLLEDIKTELEEQTTWLEKIYNAIIEFLGIEGEDSVEEMPDDDMNNMLEVEDELLGNASADDLANDLSVSIDTDSSNFIWDIINDLVTSNSAVFGGFISVLSLGVVALILGR